MFACRPLALTLALAACLGAGRAQADPADGSFSAGLVVEWPWSGFAIASVPPPVPPPYVYAQEPINAAWIGLPGGVAPVGSASPVPEPRRWATLLTGLGLVILALRRRINHQVRVRDGVTRPAARLSGFAAPDDRPARS